MSGTKLKNLDFAKVKKVPLTASGQPLASRNRQQD